MRAKYFLNSILLLSVIFVTGCHLRSTKTHSDQTKPVESKPVESKPVESKPVESKPVESKPVESKPVESKPVEPKQVEPKQVEPKPIEPKPIEPKPIEPKPIEPKPIEPKPIEPKPVEPKPVEPKPIEPIPAERISVESEKIETQSSFDLKGQITLDQTKLKNQNANIKDTIVYFEPAHSKSTKLATTKEVISTLNKRFSPNVLVITAGSQVSFPNMDRILHNVFSVSPMNDFDLGLYSAGSIEAVTFEKPGVIYVHCNVHHSMQADILVLDTPYFTQVDQGGNFALKGLPELDGTLKTWHPRGNIKSLTINKELKQKSIKQSVVITRPEVPEHTNKFGKSYRRKRY